MFSLSKNMIWKFEFRTFNCITFIESHILLNFIVQIGTGDSNSGRPPRDGVATCSQKRATCLTALVLGTLLGTALVIAYAGPQNGEWNIFIYFVVIKVFRTD